MNSHQLGKTSKCKIGSAFKVKKRKSHLAYPCKASSGDAAYEQAPLLYAVLERGQMNEIPMHVPGHKHGRGVHPSFQGMMSESLMYDLTEISGLDYLSSPQGVIAQAQQLAAKAFGAEATWFLVNGCSVGIQAAVLATTAPGQHLLLARNCHLSAFSAMVLSGCSPIWLQPEVDAEHGVAHCVSPSTVHKALEVARSRGQEVGAVMVVSPTYYGACADIAGIAKVVHEYDLPLIVDEAHGGHLKFTSDAPLCALASGADVVLQSSHKVLGALTQAAMAHVQGSRVDRGRLSRALMMLQTSSPSYLLMSSLDAARLAAVDPACFTIPVSAAQVLREGLGRLPGLKLMWWSHSEARQRGGHISATVVGWDPLRLSVDVSGLSMTGWQVAAALEDEHGVVPELATDKLVLLVMGPGTVVADAQEVVLAFSRITAKATAKARQSDRAEHEVPSRCTQPITTNAANHVRAQQHNHANSTVDHSTSAADQPSSTSDQSDPRVDEPLSTSANVPAASVDAHLDLPAMLYSPRDAFFRRSESVPFASAVGRASAELLCPYPPGVPAVLPGEEITQAALEVLTQTLANGGKVTGAEDPTLATLRVIVA